MWISVGFIVAGLIGGYDLLFSGKPGFASTLIVLLVPGFLSLFARAGAKEAQAKIPVEIQQMSRREQLSYLWSRNPRLVVGMTALVLLIWSVLMYLGWGL